MWIEIYSVTEFCKLVIVTPLAGVWIEICACFRACLRACVTPLAGVWIEIFFNLKSEDDFGSLPLRECGLK